MFANAKVMEAKPKAAKRDKKQRFEVTGLYELTLLDVAIKNLTSLKKTADQGVKAEAKELFMEQAAEVGKRPENFRGVEKEAEASVELRKRSERSPLKEAEVEALTEAGVPVGTVEDVTETFVVNPDYANDTKLLAKVEKALAGVKGLPEDLFLKQEGAARTVVTDETVDTVFANEELTEQFFDTVAVLALKPKLNEGDVGTALKYLAEVLED